MRFVDGQSDLHTNGAQPIAGRPLAPATVGATVLPSVTSGVAPLGVFFDAASSGFAGTRPLHELRFKWRFGTGGDFGALSPDHPFGTASDVAYGPRAAYVFDTPGSHVVTLEVTDGTETAVATRVITVSDPDTVYAGSLSYAISASGFDGAPTGAVQVASLADARADAVANGRREVRFLFARGQSHDISGGAGVFASGQFDALAFAAFGSGADPVLTGGGLQTEGDAFGGAVTLRDLEIRGSFDPATGLGLGGDGLDLRGAAYHSVLRCRVSGFDVALRTESGLDDVYVQECAISAWASDGIVLDSGDRLALIGCAIVPADGTDPAYVSGGPGRIEGANPGRTVLWNCEMQSVTDAPCWRWNADGATGASGVIGACRMEGGAPVLEIAPSNPGGTDRPGDLVVERCYLLAGARTGAAGAVTLTHGGTTLRNCIAVLPDVAPAGGVDATAFLTGAAPASNAANDAAPVRVHNNSLIDLRSPATLADPGTAFTEYDTGDFAHWADLEVVNQLIHAPGLQTPATPNAPLDETPVFSPREAGVPAPSAARWAPLAKIDGTDSAGPGTVALDDFRATLRGPVAEVGAYEIPGTLRITEGGLGNILVSGLAPGVAEVTIDQPADVAGSGVVDIDQLVRGPVVVRGPTITGTPSAGSTVTAQPSVLAYDPAQGAPLRTYQWVQGTADIPGETGLTHVVSNDDLLFGLFLREEAFNAGPDVLRRATELIAPPSFAEAATPVTANSTLSGGFDLGSSPIYTFAVFSCFEFTGDYGEILNYGLGGISIDITNGWEWSIRKVTGGNNPFAMPLTSVVPGTRVSALVSANHASGESVGYLKLDDGPWTKYLETTKKNWGGGGWTLAGGSVSMFDGLDVVHLRTAIFDTGQFVNFNDETLRDRFVASDGTLVNPVQSVATLGTPLLDVYGDAGSLSAGVNYGSTPDFDTIFWEGGGGSGVAPAITASDALAGRTLSIGVDSLSGTPAPSVALTVLTLDGADVSAAATGTGPWSYVVPSASVEQTVAWEVTATNASGSDSAAGSELIPEDTAPTNTALPAITGTFTTGQTLTVSQGTWTGADSLTYQWTRGGVNITGATSSTYVLQVADEGSVIGCDVTATNGAGSTIVSATGADTAQPVAGGGGGAWTPADTTTEMWLDIDDASTVTLSGSAVTQVDDKSGNARHATQANAADQPTYSATGWDGVMPAITVGSSEHLNLGEVPSDVDILIVYKPGSLSTQVSLMGRDAPTVYRLPRVVSSSSNTAGLIQVDGVADPLDSVFSLFDGETSQSFTTRSEGWSLLNASNIYALSDMRTGATGLELGRADGNFTFTGEIAEVVIIPTNLTERQKVEGYLAHKWGLTANLPADHPYKSEAPTT